MLHWLAAGIVPGYAEVVVLLRFVISCAAGYVTAQGSLRLLARLQQLSLRVANGAVHITSHRPSSVQQGMLSAEPARRPSTLASAASSSSAPSEIIDEANVALQVQEAQLEVPAASSESPTMVAASMASNDAGALPSSAPQDHRLAGASASPPLPVENTETAHPGLPLSASSPDQCEYF